MFALEVMHYVEFLTDPNLKFHILNAIKILLCKMIFGGVKVCFMVKN